MKYNKKVLKNKLTIFTLPIQEAESVVFTILVKVGSRYEVAQDAGVAHFLEHVFFKGSQNYPLPTDITGTIDAIGGDFNAATSKETTEFYIRAGKSNFDLIFHVLTDMIQNPLFPEDEIEKEKGVVIEEMNLYHDNPGAQVETDLEAVVWPKSALGREILGNKKTISDLTREQILDFKNQFYQPSNMIIGIAGAFDEQHSLELIEKYWQPLKNKLAPKYQKVTERQAKPQVSITFKDTKQAHLAIAFKSYPHGHKNNLAVSLLGSILGGSMSSRLFVTIREQKGLAYSIWASNSAYLDTGNFHVHAGLKVEKTLDAIGAILSEIRRIKTDPVPSDELKRAKDYIKGKIALALEDNQEKLNWILERFAYTGKIKTPQEIFEELDKITSAQLQKLANDLFRNERMSLAVIGPFKDKKVFAKEFYLKKNF